MTFGPDLVIAAPVSRNQDEIARYYAVKRKVEFLERAGDVLILQVML